MNKTIPGIFPKQLGLIFNKIDTVGNKLEYIETNLFLTLAKDNRRRYIGTVTFHEDGNILYTKHEMDDNVFYKTNSWSIHNYILINVDYICYITETKIYKITADKAKTSGKYLFFKDSGYELKIYVPLNFWWSELIRSNK
jgi:hypothetical protein